MANRVERLLATRDRHLKSLQHRIDVILAFDEEVSIRRAKVHKRLLDTAWNEFNTSNSQLDGLIDDDGKLAAIIQGTLDIQDAYAEAQSALDELIEDDEEENNGTLHNNSTMSDQNEAKLKIKPLELRQFTGKYEDWGEFKDMFESCISKNTRIPDVQKLHQLKNLLSEEPLKLIKNLKMRENNFEVAWKILDGHFENKHKVVWGYLQRFFEIPTVSAGNASAAELQSMLITTTDLITSLPDFGIDTSSWDAILIYVLIQKLDTVTINYWHEERKASKELPTFKNFRTFLETRKNVCESKESRRKSSSFFATSTPKLSTQKNLPKPIAKATINQVLVAKCGICDREHRTFQCPRLINATYERRLELVREKKLCENCLFAHDTEKCLSTFTCRACHTRHHTLLHPMVLSACTKVLEEEDDDETNIESAEIINEEYNSDDGACGPSGEQTNEDHTSVNLCQKEVRPKSMAMLATAVIPVFTRDGTSVLLRTLIDQGSETSLLSTRAHQLLRTKRTSENIPVVAIGNTPAGTIRHGTYIEMSSIHDDSYRYAFKTLITKTITTVSPKTSKHSTEWKHLEGLPLADPKYFEASTIDLLLGVRELAEILLPGVVKGRPSEPVAQQTKIGWILSGVCGDLSERKIQCNVISSDKNETNLAELLKAFWAIEEVNLKKVLSKEEQLAEESFVKNVQRTPDGKIMVRLPFKTDPNDSNFLGSSLERARKRFFQMERRLHAKPQLCDEYRKCINEYLELGHMRLANATEINGSQAYFMPHHAVVKESSETTKLRVVFDASAKSTNGKSLNDQLHVGPTIQHDLFTLLLQWRRFKVAFTGDIEKMYRQIWVNESDARFQRILWRNSPTEELQQYVMKTVTFGTASAPFQAIRSLFFISDNIQQTSPDIADMIREQFYVDDFLGCAETDEQAIRIHKQIMDATDGYGFKLRKWKSNSINFLEALDPSIQSKSVEHIFESPCKALGLLWHPGQDYFYFKLDWDMSKRVATKRLILSETAKIFDPLGWLAPCTVKAKILMQRLWLLPIGWDDAVPQNIEGEWKTFRNQLAECTATQIPRWSGYTSTDLNVQIHGFSDASEDAYAAVVYLSTSKGTGRQISLMAAKTKVAPLKKITLPHLELSAALLLAELMTKVQNALKLDTASVTAWTDSTIVLDWLASPSHRWKTFVANRVSKIHELIAPENWRHVPSKANPADCASRGIHLNELRAHPLWWTGPSFLQQSMDKWPRKHKIDPDQTLPDTRKVKIHHIQMQSGYNEILTKFSSLRTLLHVTAYCLRWIKYKRAHPFESTLLSANEVERARIVWLKLVQGTAYAKEIACKQKAQEQESSIIDLPRKSKLLSLNPWLDENKLLRVGGRLQESDMSRDRKQPIILPNKGHFTDLVVRDAHNNTFHGGIQLTLQTLRERYWVIQGRNTVRNHIQKCTICFRFRNEPSQQMMGNLPHFRVNEHRPFTYTGVDFAGYFDIKTSTRKNAPYTKAYVALFVCLTTKALHLEVVSSLSTEAFLLAFKRFLARKLIPKHMYSDRGTNFIGAKNELPRLLQSARSEQSMEIREELLKKEIEWHLIPAHSPHFGGIWEAGVKSTKHHLKRVLGEARLTFEEFTTIIAQIEACLNSRPLYPLTEDPQDDEMLTPNHLLFGHGAGALVEPCSADIPSRAVTRYQLIQRLHNGFWRKWSNEYLTRLQHRSKWTKSEENLRPHQVVLIKEDNLPPTKWLYGRIVKVFPGKDGLVRVAEVRCKDTVLSRPIHKLCLLPIIDNQAEVSNSN